jgi:glutamine synthetase
MMDTQPLNGRPDVLGRARSASIEVVQLQFTDVAGAIKSMTVPGSRLSRVLDHGAWFDGSSVEGFARVAESDLFLRPEPNSFVVLPWESTPTARLICDLCLPDGEPFPADPRQALKRVLADAVELGFDYRVATELEFYLFEDCDPRTSGGQLIPVDRSGYFDVQGARADKLCRVAVDALTSFGVQVEATHGEVGPGQHEIDIAELGALEAADAIVAAKWALRSMARREGLLVSFMPKPLADAPGSGLHMTQVLIDRQTGADAFFDPTQQYQLSSVGAQFIAGQLAHARGLSAIIAPLVNSYKRLGAGAEAPARVCWARVHRGALLRVPEVAVGHATRLELRAPDPSCNPYLALASMLKAGVDGIQHELELPEPARELGDAEPGEDEAASPLPATLGEALEELTWDPVVREAIGQPIFERFATAKEQEWLAFGRHTSQWELERYLDSA